MQVRASLERNGGTPRVRHIVDLLDEAYGGAKTQEVTDRPPGTGGTVGAGKPA
jgi:hypothetical protein